MVLREKKIERPAFYAEQWELENAKHEISDYKTVETELLSSCPPGDLLNWSYFPAH